MHISTASWPYMWGRMSTDVLCFDFCSATIVKHNSGIYPETRSVLCSDLARKNEWEHCPRFLDTEARLRPLTKSCNLPSTDEETFGICDIFSMKFQKPATIWSWSSYHWRHFTCVGTNPSLCLRYDAQPQSFIYRKQSTKIDIQFPRILGILPPSTSRTCLDNAMIATQNDVQDCLYGAGVIW